MKDYYCINLRFKDHKISKKKFHSHLFVSDKEMYFQIFDNDKNSMVDKYFTMSENALGLFEENFELIDKNISIKFENSRIYKIVTFQNNNKNKYFTIYVSKVCIIREYIYKENINEGAAYLNKNGLKVVNLFYSFFSNLRNKNFFSISRMDNMHDFYKISNMEFRPELEFQSNERKGSEEFTIKKIPIINFKFSDLKFDEIKKNIDLICNFLSLCFGVRIIVDKILFRTDNEIFIFRDLEPNNKTYVSDFNTVFGLLENNYYIENILKTNWFDKYVAKEKQISKAIDNILHSREVSLGASFLLLFNIIEIFNINKEQEKFEFTVSKDEILQLLSIQLKNYLSNQNEEIEFKRKLASVINKLEYKPFKSPLEETLLSNNIDCTKFGFSFSKLKKTRDCITHGSINSIKEENLQLQVYCLRKVATSLILAQLGLKEDLNNNVN